MEYELLFFISVANEDRIGEIKKKLVELIEGQGGKISSDFSDIGKRKLAYPIKKQTHGFFSFCRFQLNNKDNLSEISRRLALNDKIMRYLIVRANEIGKPIAIQTAAVQKPEIEERETAVKQEEEKPTKTKSKIEIAELDEKLSEILEEKLE